MQGIQLGDGIMNIDNTIPGRLKILKPQAVASQIKILYSLTCSSNGMAPIPVIILVDSSDTL